MSMTKIDNVRVYNFSTPEAETKIHLTRCSECNDFNVIQVNADLYRQWIQGVLIQNAFGFLSVDERELLVTGIHPECWEAMFS